MKPTTTIESEMKSIIWQIDIGEISYDQANDKLLSLLQTTIRESLGDKLKDEPYKGHYVVNPDYAKGSNDRLDTITSNLKKKGLL